MVVTVKMFQLLYTELLQIAVTFGKAFRILNWAHYSIHYASMGSRKRTVYPCELNKVFSSKLRNTEYDGHLKKARGYNIGTVITKMRAPVQKSSSSL